MNEARRKKIVLCVVVAIAALPLACILLLGSWGYLSSRGRNDVKETTNIQGELKTRFVEAFIPGVSISDIARLDYSFTGGREPMYAARAVLSTSGLDSLRHETEFMKKGRFKELDTDSMFGSFRLGKLVEKTEWWLPETNGLYELRSIHWKGDHVAQFFIPISGDTTVYIEALAY